MVALLIYSKSSIGPTLQKALNPNALPIRGVTPKHIQGQEVERT